MRVTIRHLGWWGVASSLLAGPPLSVDDSETLKRGEIEIFTSGQFTRLRNGGRSWEAPAELTVGWKHDIEFSLATGWTDLRDPTAPGRVRGFLALDPGMKWAFRPSADDRAVSAALGWKLHLPLGEGARRAGIGGFGAALNLATSWTTKVATLDLNVGLGHVTASAGARARQEVFLGAALRRELLKERLTAFFEVYATPDLRRFGSAEVRADLGLLWDVSPKLRWSVLAGRGFRDDGADYFCNLGVLISFGSKPVTAAVGHAGRAAVKR